MITLAGIDRYIAKVSDDLAKEEARIAAGVTAKTLGGTGGYWQRAYTLRSRLAVARELRAAVIEVVAAIRPSVEPLPRTQGETNEKQAD